MKRLFDYLSSMLEDFFTLPSVRCGVDLTKPKPKAPTYTCDQCGQQCKPDSLNPDIPIISAVPSSKNEHGHRLLCPLCHNWRENIRNVMNK